MVLYESKKHPYPENVLYMLGLTGPLNEDQADGFVYALQLLPEKYKEPVRLYFEEGFTQKQIGQRLGYSSSYARTMLVGAMRRLRRKDHVRYIKQGLLYSQKLEAEIAQEKERRRKFLEENPEYTPIPQAGFSPLICNILMDEGLKTAGDVAKFVYDNPSFYINIYGCGPQKAKEIYKVLNKMGLDDKYIKRSCETSAPVNLIDNHIK